MKSMLKKVFAHGIIAMTSDKKAILPSYDDALKELDTQCTRKEVVIARDNNISPKYDLMIIIPVHNVEKYVKKCIDSVLNQQTKYSVDIYVVENGSSDKSLDIIREYNETSTLHIWSISEVGLSEARNYALRNITGEYVMFLDSDDYLEQGAVENLMNMAKKYDADIVEGNYRVFKDDGEIIKTTKYSGSRSIADCRNDLVGMAMMKVMRAELWKNTVFPAGYLYEDSIMSYSIYPFCERKYRIDDIVYNYRRNEAGITSTSVHSNRAIETIWITDALWKDLTSKKKLNDELYIKFIEQLRLNQSRIEKLDIKIQKCGFVIARQYLCNIKYDCQTELSKKHNMFVNSILLNSFKRYVVISRYWDYL